MIDKMKSFMILISYIAFVNAWTSDDLELFDIVEDINQNFYDVLDIDHVCFKMVYTYQK